MRQTLHMRNILRSVLCSAAVATAACTFTACEREMEEAIAPEEVLQNSSENGAIIPGQYIVVFKGAETLRLSSSATYAQRVDAVRDMGQAILTANGIQDVVIEQAYGKAIIGVAAKLTEMQVESLKKDPLVDYIEPDRLMILAKPDFAGGGGGSTAEETPWGVARVGTSDGAAEKSKAWVIDTGIDLRHSDLIVDKNQSKTFVTTGKDARSADDGNGHGTHVAGTIAAIKGNGIGVVGVAYGATVVAVKVLNSQGSGSYSGVIAGVDYVAANAAAGDVANMSLGGPVSTALDAAVVAAANKGIKFALAAGNESTHAQNSSPARVNHTNVYTVSAMSSGDKWASFSNYGNPPVDYCAPGVSIKSTWKDGGYNTISGTSMAAPHVAGLLLLGNIRTDGNVLNDPDGKADPIAHR